MKYEYGNERTELIAIRLSKQEKEAVQAAASRKDIPVS